MADAIRSSYIECLCRWIPFSRTHFFYPPDRPDLACYGTGYDEWGIQTCQKAFCAYAVLATDPLTDEKATGMTRQELLADAKKQLRFILSAHIVGNYHCLDGRKWGHTWLTSVGTERMMHGVEAIWGQLDSEEKALLRSVLISESDWLTDHYPVLAGRVQNNRPESNIWNGSLLFRTATMYPDTPRAVEYRRKSQSFLINGLSLESDRASDQTYDGDRIRDLYVGDNLFPSFALGHHEYLNLGYMVVSLSHMAMLYYFCKHQGIQPPQALFHHLNEAWSMVRLCMYPDGRLLRIGGDNRVRYCYCQDYLIPTWVFMEEYLGDHACAAWEEGWLKQIHMEMQANGDGSFLSRRCKDLDVISPLYYTRLEADRACALSMGAYWRREGGTEATSPCLTTGTWQDGYHGACFVKSKKRIASWVWGAAERPTGLCLPADSSNLAEWRENLSGQICGYGDSNHQQVIAHYEETFPGGYVTCGITAVESDQFAAEGQLKETLAYKHIACAALPDDQTVLVLQYAKANIRAYLTELKGLFLNIPNDVFNNESRTYYTDNGSLTLHSCPGTKETLPLDSKWLNVEDKLGVVVVYGPTLSIHRPANRQIGIQPAFDAMGSGDVGMLYCDEICSTCQTGRWNVPSGTELLDVGFAVLADANRAQTAQFSQNECQTLSFPDTDVRGMKVIGANGIEYTFVANFGEKPICIDVDGRSISLFGMRAILL